MQPSLKTQKPAHPLRAVCLIISSIFVLLSLITYSIHDPSWSFSSSEDAPIQNWGGLVGSYIADGLLQLLGLVAYCLAIGGLVVGIQFLQIKIISMNDSVASHKKPKWHFPLSIALFVICFSGLLSLIPFHIYSTIYFGGMIGHFVAEAGVFCFSPVGASLIFVGGLWASSVLYTDRWNPLPSSMQTDSATQSLKNTLEKLKLFFMRPATAISSLLQRRKGPQVHTSTAVSPKLEPSVSKKLEELFKKRVEPAPVAEPIAEAAFEESKVPVLSNLKLPLIGSKTDNTSDNERVLLVDHAPKRKKTQTPKEYSNFELPSPQLLDLDQERGFEISKDELIANSRALEQKLLDFGIQGQVTNIRPGPIITLYEFEPAPGVKVKNIINLTDDLKLAMKAVSIRIIAPIPGRAAVGIEIPNPRRQTVYLREILQSPLFQNSLSPLTMGMGKTTSGEPYVADLAKMPHLLIAGATGSGKSVGLNAMVVSMLFKASPDELKFIMIDPKMLELSVYEGIPHLLLPVVTDPKKAARALAWAVKEMERRYKLISSLGARNLKSFNEKVEKLSAEELKREVEMAKEVEASTEAIISDEQDSIEAQQEIALQQAGLDHYVKLPNIVVVIDELADLIMVAARDVEESIARLAQMARAAGIHLIIATQRPSVDVITGVIKANLPTRCAFQVASKVDSRTIIDGSGAENLIGDGDMLFLPPGTSRLERLHGPFISEDEISRVVRHLKSQGNPDYNTNIDLEDATETSSETGSEAEDIDDELYDQALQVVFETKSPSASMLQRRLRVGYNRAARMIERMEREGIVSAPLGGGKGREILITPSYESSGS